MHITETVYDLQRQQKRHTKKSTETHSGVTLCNDEAQKFAIAYTHHYVYVDFKDRARERGIGWCVSYTIKINQLQILRFWC